jgi:hypothetical protein
MNNLRLVVPLLFMAFFYCTGSFTSVAGGGSSQQGNGTIAGSAFTAGGLPAAGAIVHIRPHDYVETLLPEKIPGKIFDALTDNSGHFSISGIEPDSFTVEINDMEYSAIAINVGVNQQDTVVDLGRRTLLPYAKIAGTIDTTDFGRRSFFIQVYGLERLMQVDTNGHFMLTNLPEGTFNLQLKSFNPALPSEEVVNVHTPSGTTTYVMISIGWRYFRQIYFNTTSSGAGVSGNVYDFPVLVRLSSDNFDFSQAGSNGEDIRFVKSDGTPLSYEIERWDAVAQKAEVWIKVDTIFGNDSTHSITLYWGASAVGSATGSLSNGAATFDTANGFQGVWHLGEDPVGVPNSIKDQTAHGCNGTPHGSMTGLAAADGIAGKAASFNGVDDYITIPRPVQDDFTIGFWMKADTDSRTTTQWWSGDGLVDGDVGQKQDADFGVAYMNNRPAFGTCCNDTTLEADVMVNDAQWHAVAVTREKVSGAKAIFVDGRLAGTQTGTTLSLTGPDSLAFGKIISNTTAFRGKLDEIQISRVVRSADWIKLSYMNQKAASSLVTIK